VHGLHTESFSFSFASVLFRSCANPRSSQLRLQARDQIDLYTVIHLFDVRSSTFAVIRRLSHVKQKLSVRQRIDFAAVLTNPVGPSEKVR
jgi:hypothetical protein